MAKVFLFGAGASREYRGALGGFFIDSTFFHVVDEMCAGWLRNGAPPDLEHAYPGGPQHYDGSRWRWTDLEVILAREFGTTFRSLGLERTYSRVAGLGQRETDLYIRCIELALFHQLRAGERKNVDVHFRFLQRVLEPGDTLLTFNYDPVLEIAAQHLGDDGRVYWHPLDGHGITLVEFGGNSSDAPLRASDVRILKLHGSVNWLTPSGAPPRPPYRLLRILPSSLHGQGWVVRRDDEGRAMRPVIVPPHPDKDYDAVGLRPIWDAAERALTEATSLTVIGYRLPETDRGALDLMRRVAPSLKQHAEIRFVTQDDKDAVARFLVLFPRAEINQGGFRAFVDAAGC